MKKGINFRYFGKDLFRALKLIWRAARGMAIANVFLQFFQALLPIASLYLIKLLVELLVAGHSGGVEKILPVIIGFCLVQFFLAVANQFSTYINALQQQKITDYVLGLVLNKAIDVDLEYYENPDYHDNLHLAQEQSQYRVPQLVTSVNGLLMNSLSMLFLIGFFFTLQWFYAVLFVVLSIPLAVVKWLYSHQLYRLERRFVPQEREANYIHQVLTGVNYAKEVRSFGFAKLFIGKYQKVRSAIYDGKKALHIKLNTYSLLTQVLEAVVTIGIFISLAKNAWAGVISVGVLVVYIQGFQRLQSTSKNFLQSFIQVFQQRLFLKDLFRFFDITSGIKHGNRPFPEVTKGLVVDKLSFTYPQTIKLVLKDVSVTCKPGEVIGIVGENGSGKSTLVKLLAGLYSIQSGSIKIDGYDTNAVSADAFRANTFFLFQDLEKYFLTVEDIIALAGGEDDSTDKVRKSATLAGAHGFITTLSNGYKTRLGRTFHESEQLSGGQWQKLALARMFYKSAKVIVLDEPTSNIDAIAEYGLFENLKKIAAGKVVVLISHRLYNLKITDNIYVMKDGCIAEEGSFDTLLNRGGIFKQMYDNQKL